MSTVQEIQKAISKLSPCEPALFRSRFEEFDARLWDEQFEEDARSGKLDRIAERAIAEYRAGNAKEM